MKAIPVQGTLRLRGHTLLCLQGFRGKGYSPGFVENLAAIHRELTANPDRSVEVVDGPDAVCGACPHQAISGCTLSGEASEEAMQAQDRHVLALLGLQAGMSVQWCTILERIGQSVRGDDLPGICGQCRWLPLGYCKEGIERLRQGSSQ
ncbi:MAG: DUF1284 domain-containing protein [Nitrospira sp.]|nr:DUF1284 domain-containing protein [Nitrospira sp.]